MENQEQTAPAQEVSDEAASNGASRAKQDKARPTRYLPSDRIAFPRQLEIIRAYGALSGQAGKPVTNRQVAEMLKMSESTVSLLNPFLTDSGFIRRSDRGFVPAQEVVNFNRANEWNPQTASTKLRPLLEHSWFGSALLPRVSFAPISEDDALDTLAETVTATASFKPQLRLLLDYLTVGGVIERDGSLVKKARDGLPERLEAAEDTTAAETVELGPSESSGRGGSVVTAFAQPAEGTVQFHVSVKVDMAEFAGWDPGRISAFFAGIAQVLAAKGAIEKEVSPE